LLSGLGLTTALGGPHWGADTLEVLGRYAQRYGIDVAGITLDRDYPGVRDIVFVDDRERAVFGWFGRYFSEQQRRWGEPDPAAVARARVVAIDPYFPGSSLRAAELALSAGKPYVTIDCPYDGALHGAAAATVISREYRAQTYPGVPDEGLFAEYRARAAGLCVFTSGKEPIRFARPTGDVETFAPFRVTVKSTLGAGDTFRAGIVYGVLRGFSDRECVRFASGLAALLCTRLPIADNVPSLAEVDAFLKTQPDA
jgi:sugar/nucleoside kinase (ribokinase family)